METRTTSVPPDPSVIDLLYQSRRCSFNPATEFGASTLKIVDRLIEEYNLTNEITPPIVTKVGDTMKIGATRNRARKLHDSIQIVIDIPADDNYTIRMQKTIYKSVRNIKVEGKSYEVMSTPNKEYIEINIPLTKGVKHLQCI